MIVSSPGSPSSSSDSQSGSDTVKQFLPSRVTSPAVRSSPSSQQSLRSSPSVSQQIKHSPSGGLSSSNSPGPRGSPSVTSLSRASPSILSQHSRSNSPARTTQESSRSTTTSYGYSYGNGIVTSSSSINTTAGNLFSYSQPATYASTNPFITGAYLNYNPENSSDKSSVKETKSFFESYNTSSTKSTYEPTDSISYSSASKYNTIGKFGNNDKPSYLSSTYSSTDLKYSNGKESSKSYDVSPNLPGGINPSLLNVEDTPTPTSSIETEDSNTREVGEKDVEGDGEQSD